MMSIWSGIEQRHPDAGHEPGRARADGAGAAAVADVGPVLREQPQGRRGADVPEALELVELYERMAQLADASPSARRSGCGCSRSTPTAGVHDRHRHARAAAGRRARQAAQRAGRGHLQLGSRARTSACTTPTRSGSTPRSAADAALRRQAHAADDPDADRDQHHRLHDHPAAAGRLPRKLHRRAAGAGRIGRSAEDRVPAQAVRPRQAARRAVPALGRRHAASAISAIRSSSTCR